MKNIIDSLKWRYAVQVFDQEKKLTEAQLDTVLEGARLSPSSYGLQPWKFIVVNNTKIRSKLREAGYGQAKISEASHLVVIAVPRVLDDSTVDEYIQSVADIRGVSIESLDGFSHALKGSVNGRTPQERVEWATRQAYIALGILLATAASERIDAGPMEGFDPKKFDEILELKKIGLESKVIVALGFRSESDVMAHTPKVRFPKEKVVIEIN